jgi:hypothetical protein
MKWVKDYEGHYKVSEDGNVYSFKNKEPYKMKGFPSPKGYIRITLTKEGKMKQVFVHRLVATSFIGDIQEGYFVNHINGDKKDNRVTNLEIVTQSYNSRHSCYVLKHSVKPVKCYELGTNFEIAEFQSITAASVLTGIQETSIYRCCVGERNKAGNFKWRFAKESGY